MKVKVAEATNIQLDRMVAMGLGYALTTDGISTLVDIAGRLVILGPCTTGNGFACGYSPSTDPAHGQPMLEQLKITTAWREALGEWFACLGDVADEETLGSFGVTALVAGMRCFITATLGEVVDIPDALAPNPQMLQTSRKLASC